MQLIRTAVDVFRESARQVWRQKGVSLLVITMCGASVAVATLLTAAVHSVLTTRIPLVETRGLMEAYRVVPASGAKMPAWSYPQVEAFERSATLTDFAGVAYFAKTFQSPAGAEYVMFEAVSTNYPEVVGVRPIAGRWFTAEENEVPMRDDVVVLGYEVCRKLFASVDRCVGQTINAGAAELSVIGVMPAGFKGLRTYADAGAWTPIMLAPLGFPARADPSSYLRAATGQFVTLVGRVKSPSALAAAKSEYQQLARDFVIEQGWATPATPPDQWPIFALTSIAESRVDPVVARAGRIVNGAVVVLLLMMCGNATLMLLAQAHARIRQTSIRMALGASARRITAGILLDTLIVASVAVAAGVALASALAWALVRVAGSVPEWQLAGLTLSADSIRAAILGSAVLPAIGAALALAVAAVVSWRVVNAGLTSVVSPGLMRRMAGSLRLRRWQAAVVFLQMASVSALVLVGALMVKSYQRAVGEPVGFALEGRVAVVQLPASVRAAEADRIADDVRAVPGISRVARVSCLPLSRSCLSGGLQIQRPARSATVLVNRIDAASLDLLGISIVRGASLAASDANAALLSLSALRSVGLTAADAIGARVTVSGVGEVTVAGVTADVKYDGLTDVAKPVVYLPWAERSVESPTALLVETPGAAWAFAGAIRTAMAGRGGDASGAKIATFAELFREGAMEQWLQMLLLMALGVTGLSIAMAGILGVTSFVVGHGASEIGLRLALGATRLSVMLLVVKRVGIAIAAGVAAGLLLLSAGNASLRPMLYKIDPADPWILAACALGCLLVGIGNVLWSARRIARIDPALTLRQE